MRQFRTSSSDEQLHRFANAQLTSVSTYKSHSVITGHSHALYIHGAAKSNPLKSFLPFSRQPLYFNTFCCSSRSRFFFIFLRDHLAFYHALKHVCIVKLDVPLAIANENLYFRYDSNIPMMQ